MMCITVKHEGHMSHIDVAGLAGLVPRYIFMTCLEVEVMNDVTC